MRILGIDDKKDYKDNYKIIKRTSARAIIIEDNKVYMTHSKNKGYYKLPGGGVDEGETLIDTCIRETREEVGLVVIPESIELYGVYIERRKSIKTYEKNTIWENTSYCYLVKVEPKKYRLKPTKNERLDDVERVLISPHDAILNNEKVDDNFIFRENEILKIINDELLK